MSKGRRHKFVRIFRKVRVKVFYRDLGWVFGPLKCEGFFADNRNHKQRGEHNSASNLYIAKQTWCAQLFEHLLVHLTRRIFVVKADIANS